MCVWLCIVFHLPAHSLSFAVLQAHNITPDLKHTLTALATRFGIVRVEFPSVEIVLFSVYAHKDLKFVAYRE